MGSFGESTGAATALCTDKRELLRSLLRPISEGTGSPARLSEAQARLWEIENYESTPGIHDFSLAYSIQGALDAVVLDKALGVVASRHPTLHTRIVNRGGQPELEEVSLTEPLIETRSAGIDMAHLLAEEAARPLDPRSGCGWNAVLFRASPDIHTLLLHFHHIFVDRWSVAVLIKELSAAYVALREGQQPVLAPAPTQVSEPAASAADLLCWKRVFHKTPEPLRLPLTRSSQVIADYSGARLRFEVCGATAQALKSAAATQSATLFSALVAGFAAFLHAHTGQEDIVLCTPVVGRHRTGTRSAIGYFNNILPMRLDLSGDPDFRSLVGLVRLHTSEIFAAQDVPFHRILQLPELGGRRITQCLVALQNIPGLNLEIPGIISNYEDIHNGTANFDVVLFFEERDGKLLCLFDYKSSVLEPASAELFRDALLAFLDGVAEQPSARLSDLVGDFTFAVANAQETPHPKGCGDAAQNVAAEGTIGYVAPRNEVEQYLADIWAELLSTARVGIHDNFFDLGAHSLLAVRALARILEKWPYQNVTIAIFIQAPTVAEFAALLESRTLISTGCVVPYRKSGTKHPFFCLPGGGGNVLYLRGLAAATSNDQPLYCLQAKGLDGSAPLTSVEEAAEFYIREIRAIQPQGPYFIGGASFGGAIAFEMARSLREQGEEVGMLALLDAYNFAYAQTLPKAVRFYETAKFFRRRLTYHIKKMRDVPLRDRGHYLSGRTKSARHYLSQLMAVARGDSRNDVQVKGLLERVGNNAGVMKERLNRVADASIDAAKTYRPQYYDGEITIFKASEQRDSPDNDPALGWTPFANKVHVIEIEGNHMNLLSQPRVATVAEHIEAATERSRRRSG